MSVTIVTNMKKAIPSELLFKIGWLAGIVDGEGCVSHYNVKRRSYYSSIRNKTYERKLSPMYAVVIVNTDLGIVNEVENVLKELDIFYATNIKTSSTKFREGSFAPSKDCYQVSVRRRLDVEKLLKIIEPYLYGKKKQKAIDLLKFFSLNPFNSKKRRVETKRVPPQ